MQAIVYAAVEAARAVVQTMVVARKENNDRMENTICKIGGTIMQQSMFNWEAEDKFSELKKFIPEVHNISESYNTL